MAKKKRTSPAKKARREASWARGQQRKAEKKAARKAAEARNEALRADGKPTPWEAARAARKARRAAARRPQAA